MGPAGWMEHWLNGHVFAQAPGDGEEQGSLVCCRPRGPKEQTQQRESTTTKSVQRASLLLFLPSLWKSGMIEDFYLDTPSPDAELRRNRDPEVPRRR